MFGENTIISLSQRLKKREILSENIQSNGALIFMKKRKENNSETHNRSIDFFEKTANLFNKSEKLREKKNINKSIIRSTGKNSEKNMLKKPFNQFFENNINKRIFSKKKLLEQILQNKIPDTIKDKVRTNNLNSNVIKLSKIFSKSNLLINDYSSLNNCYDPNKINYFKIKSDFIEGGKTGNYKGNKTFIQEKLEQINMNKTALFKKIKFESLKKFCKNVKLADKKLGINIIMRKEQNTKSEVRKNNCEEIKINTIKEKVRNYFIGRFNNIKEYFDNWDEQKQGKININDIYNYLNKKIKFKISKNETKKLIYSFVNRNYLDLENFRIIFFENSTKEKLFVRGNKLFEQNVTLTKNFSEISQINRSENNFNISFFEKFRYNEIISLILKQKNLILSQINRDRIELTFIEFYSILRDIIKEKKFNFDKEIKRLFNDFKENNSDLINIYSFFEKINEKKEENQKNHSIINIKKHINRGIKPFYNKNKSSFIVLNSRNTKNDNFSYKDSHQTKTNFMIDKGFNKEIEKNQKKQINKNINNLQRLKNININFMKEKEKQREQRNAFNSKFLLAGLKNKSYNGYVSNENRGKNYIINENSKLKDLQLPNILNHERNKNRNSDIIDIL